MAETATDTGDDLAVIAEAFRAQGWVLTRTLDAGATAVLQEWIDEVAAWPDDAGQWMHHRESEAARFVALPDAADALRLRGWDDAGKDLHVTPRPIADHGPLLERLAQAARPT